MGYLNGECKIIKIHRLTPHTGITINTWTDCDTFSKIDEESNTDCLTLNADNKTIDVHEDGFYIFGGCVHYQDNLGGGFNNLTILIRLLESGTEMKCSQRGKRQELRGGGEDVLSYNATAYLLSGDTVNLQYYTNEADLEFNSNSLFDQQVAYTLWAFKCNS